MKTKTKIGLTIGLLSLLAITGLTQSKYVRTSDVTLNVSQDTAIAPETIANNTGANGALNYTNYTVQKTGYYAIQLKGGDGGTNNDGTGGRGGVVEGVYKLNAGQVISYTLGGVGGHYAAGSDNKTAGASYYGTDGVGGRGGDQNGANVYDRSSREGSGGGGASAVKLGSSSGPDLLVAGGGGGGAGGSSTVTLYPIVSPRPGGTGASNTTGVTGVIQGTKSPTVPGERNSDKNGETATAQASLFAPNNKSEAGGGAGGGYGTQNLGGKAGTRNSSTVTGGGEGGNSYVNPTGYLANSYDLIHSTFASVLTGSTFTQVTGIGGSSGTNKAGQLRIAYLYTDDLQGASLVVNDIYKGNN